jgi:hypothetical protein
MESFKCLFDGISEPMVFVKHGEIMELECDCRLIPIGIYKGTNKDGADCWVSTDIKTGLCLVKARTKKRCVEDTKSLLMYKGYKAYRNMQEQARIKFLQTYNGEEWNSETKG